MIRRTVHYLFRDDAPPDERRRLMRALAWVGLESPMVVAADYGDDVAGGSARLVEIPPWERMPRFHARADGPPSNYDAALHLDFEDEVGLAAFEADPAALELDRLVLPVVVGELTARVDWRHDGEVAARRGGFRHSALFIWRDDAADAARSRALDAVRGLAGVAGVEAVAAGESATAAARDFDWALDILLADESSARSLIGGVAYAEAAAAAAAATKHEWTTRVTHRVRGT